LNAASGFVIRPVSARGSRGGFGSLLGVRRTDGEVLDERVIG
jgi:hypothetical protein